MTIVSNKHIQEINMRTIKFRAWDKSELQMKSDGFLIRPWDGVPMKDVYICDFILMQYTGLKDKNGKEIYEGDIVKRYEEANEDFGYEIGIIQWSLSRCYFELQGQKNYWGCPDVRTAKEKLEIIGNIYANKDLLTNN